MNVIFCNKVHYHGSKALLGFCLWNVSNMLHQGDGVLTVIQGSVIQEQRKNNHTVFFSVSPGAEALLMAVMRPPKC